MHFLHPSPFTGIMLALIGAFGIAGFQLHARSVPVPSLIPTPAALDVPYSAENPPGPTFSEAEKRQQVIDGQRIRAEILEAFHEGRDGYTISPGNYRFDSKYQEVHGNTFALVDLHRDQSNPFQIKGYGVTFWFNLDDTPAPHYLQMIKVLNCSHLSIEGLTVDSDPRGCMDAKITAFDFEGNRIQVKPVEGTRLIQKAPLHENRFIPYKWNGHHIASLYQIDSDWGPGNVLYEKMERTEDGLYWFTLKSKKLLEAVKDPQWRVAYGSEGTLEVGDMLGFVYNVSSAITVLNCERITVRDCRFHAAKAGIVERDGYGDHRWINCHLMARPGTNNLLGGDGVMSSCMHGSTFEGTVVQRTTDDCFNSHGRWNHAESATIRSITFRKALPPGLSRGHTAEAFDTMNDTFLGTLTVKAVDDRTVSFEEAVGERYAKAGVIFREFQNAGWAIRNSIFSDCYQRIRLMCGPGVFENNLIERVGAGLTFGNGKPVDPEGGLTDDVIIRDNVFIDTALSPPLRAIQVKTKGAPVRNLEVSGNVICNSGSEALYFFWADNLLVRNNILFHPGKGQALWSSSRASSRQPAGIYLERIRGAKISGNVVIPNTPTASILQKTDAESAVEEDNRVAEDSTDSLENMVRELTYRHGQRLSETVEKVRAALSRSRP